VASSEQPTAWKIILELMTGNVIISKVDALMYVVIKQGRRPLVLLGISWYHRMYDAISEVSHTYWGYYNQVQLYLRVRLCTREVMEGMKGRQSQKFYLMMKVSNGKNVEE